MLTWPEVWLYVRMVLRWWWVLVLAAALAGGTAFYLVRNQPNYYSTRVTIMVGDSFTAASPDQFAFNVSNTLASFYGELAKRKTILLPVAEKLKLPFSWEVLSYGMVYSNVNARANLLEVWVSDTSPERAAAIANAIADELILFSPNSPEKVAEQRQILQEQIRTSEQNLQNVEERIKELKARQAILESAIDLRDVEDQISELEKARDRYQTTYNQQLGLLNNSTVNSLSIFERAEVPTSPLPSKRLLTVAMASGGGLLLAILAVLLLDRFDERWRGARDLRTRFGVSDLGTIPTGPPMAMATPEEAMQREPAVRDAHTRILLAAIERGTRLLLVSSPAPCLSRSAFSVDLADLFTRSGYRVLLVDADMTVPNLTNLIGQPENAARPVVIHNGDVKMWSYLQPTLLENVMLLGRRIGPDGKPMVPSLPWPELVQSLNRAADVIIFDGPSTMSSADAALLAPLVDGVVLLLDPTRDTRSTITESKSRLLRRRGANLLGAVVVKHPRSPGFFGRRQLKSSPAPALLTADTPQDNAADHTTDDSVKDWQPNNSTAVPTSHQMTEQTHPSIVTPPPTMPLITPPPQPESGETLETGQASAEPVVVVAAAPAANERANGNGLSRRKRGQSPSSHLRQPRRSRAVGETEGSS